jgi:hypothetical protein
VVAGATRLMGSVTAGGTPVTVTVGGTASGLFAAVVATTVVGAGINTFLTAGDVGWDAGLAAAGRRGRGGGGGEVKREVVAEVEWAGVGRRRAAYEVFP